MIERQIEELKAVRDNISDVKINLIDACVYGHTDWNCGDLAKLDEARKCVNEAIHCLNQCL